MLLKKILQLKIIISLVAIIIATLFVLQYNYTWQWNNLRFMYYPFRVHKLITSGTIFTPPSRAGLGDLQISGSANINKSVLEKVEKEVKAKFPHIENIIVINITDEEESGNYYYKGIPITRFLYHKTFDERAIDPIRNQSIFKQLRSYLYHKIYGFDKDSIESSREFVERQGFKFIRCNAKRHYALSADNYQCLLDAINNTTKNDWIHVHCAAGHGRTTTFLVMYDIIHNASRVSLEDIVMRQYLLGGENLFIQPQAQGSWPPAEIIRRKKNIELFYRYVQDPDGFGSTSWLDWSANYNAN